MFDMKHDTINFTTDQDSRIKFTAYSCYLTTLDTNKNRNFHMTQ